MTARVTRDTEADAAYVYLTDEREPRAAETRELVPEAVLADYAADGSLIGIEFLWVSEGVSLDGVPDAEGVAKALAAAGIAVNAPAGVARTSSAG